MSKTTIALEAAVAAVLAQLPNTEGLSAARQRANIDKAFTAILKLIAPRIRHFIRQYGLVSHWEDAEQCCAIAVHRALQGYDPAKAQFTTFVNWQIRGELQSLRFRLMTDQRPSAKRVAATTVSLHAVSTTGEGEENSLESMLLDEESLERTESGASSYMADTTRTRLVSEYVEHLRTVGMDQLKRRARTRAPAAGTTTGPRLRSDLYPVDPTEVRALEERIATHREAIERRLSLSEEENAVSMIDDAARERSRQVAKRAAVAIAELAQRTPRFADGLRSPALPARPRAIAKSADAAAR